MAKNALSDIEKRVAERSEELRSVLQTSKKTLDNIKKISSIAKEEGIESGDIDRIVDAMESAVGIMLDATRVDVTKK